MASNQHGFSMVELLVVCSIAVVITALALPATNGMIATAKLRANVTALGGFIQNCRSTAIRTNSPKRIGFTTSGASALVYITDSSNTGGPQTGDPVYLMDPGVNLNRTLPDGGTATALETSSIWAAGTTALSSDASFNSRGLPCKYTTFCSPGVGFVYYFSYYPAIAAPQWFAVSISPAGRIALWYWDGTKWTG